MLTVHALQVPSGDEDWRIYTQQRMRSMCVQKSLRRALAQAAPPGHMRGHANGYVFACYATCSGPDMNGVLCRQRSNPLLCTHTLSLASQNDTSPSKRPIPSSFCKPPGTCTHHGADLASQSKGGESTGVNTTVQVADVNLHAGVVLGGDQLVAPRAVLTKRM